MEDNAPEQILFDVNELGKDKKFFSLRPLDPDDGHKLSQTAEKPQFNDTALPRIELSQLVKGLVNRNHIQTG